MTTALRNLHPEARLARWRTAIAQAGEMDPTARRSHLELIGQMLHDKATRTTDPYRGQLERLLERVMFLLRPCRADELYPGSEDDDLDEDADFDW